MRTFHRYLLFQAPGWALAAVCAVALWLWAGINQWLAIGLCALWVVKDFVLYPLVRGAYERDVKTGVELLVGMVGVATGRLDPRGFVRVRGESWQAEIEKGASPIESGSSVRVARVRGLTLLVAAHESGCDESREGGRSGSLSSA